MSRIQTLRDFIGAVIDESRLARGGQRRIEDKLDLIIKRLGDKDADFATLAKQVQQHERRLAGVGR